ncbi:MAG: glycine cleavage system protein GcvH [Bacteroidota bacterium]
MNIPESLRYTEDHEWIKPVEGEEGMALIGITDYAQSELGDLVYVEVETEGGQLSKGEIFGSVEAVKTTSDLYMPITGEVVSFNAELEDAPETINEDPYEKGWIIKVKLDDPAEIEGLMSAAEYAEAIAQ